MLPAINCGKTLGGPISRQIPVYRIATNDRIDPALTYARPMSSPSFFDNAYGCTGVCGCDSSIGTYVGLTKACLPSARRI